MQPAREKSRKTTKPEIQDKYTTTTMFFLISGASPTRRDLGRGFTAAQWSHYCGRHICAESIEKFVRTALPNGGNSTNQTNNLSGITSSGNTSGKISRQNKEKKKKNNNRQVFWGKMLNSMY